MTTASANISDLKNPPARIIEPQTAMSFFDLRGFELMQRVAKMLSTSQLLPEIYRGSEGLSNCIIVLNMAQRMQADPLMIAQNLYVVHGRPAWSAQFLIACFNQCGRFSAIRYRWQGTQPGSDWGCRAFAKELATGEEIIGPLVTIATAKAEGWIDRKGSKWLTIPELMLTYRAAAWMVRTHAPELAMGLPTAEELHDYIDVTPAREPLTPEGIKEAAHTVASQPQTADAPDSTPRESAPLATAADLLGDGPAYAEIADRINGAKSKDAVDTALSLIHPGLPEKQRAELADLGRAQKLSIGE